MAPQVPTVEVTQGDSEFYACSIEDEGFYITSSCCGCTGVYLTDEQAEQLERALYLHRINKAFPVRVADEEDTT